MEPLTEQNNTMGQPIARQSEDDCSTINPAVANGNSTGAATTADADTIAATTAAVQEGEKLLRANPAARQILLWALQRCENEMVELPILEKEILASDAYTKGCPEPFFVAQWLVDARCLDFFNIDREGNVVDASVLAQAGLSNDEIDDIITGYAYRTNEVGRTVAQQFNPTLRMQKLLDTNPEGADILLDALEFLRSPRSLDEVDSFLENTLTSNQAEKMADMAKPSVLVNALSDTDAVEFAHHGWQTTTEGGGFLEKVKRAKRD